MISGLVAGAAKLAQPLLLALPPEQAHEATLVALEKGLYPRSSVTGDPRIAVEVLGLKFPNPVGMAPGFDKEGRAPDALLDIGFGFAEVGTITPLPQPGNPAPRVFRLPRDRGVINRLGFNSGGHAAALARLARRQKRGVVGINVGANKESPDRAGDYVKGIEAFAGIASYFTANISSPNTPGLRDLQAPAVLDQLLERVMAARDKIAASGGRRVPVLVKIAPDIAEQDIEPIVDRMIAHGVDGIIVGNTTLSRHGIRDVEIGREAGGLSGQPLFHRSTVMLAKVALVTRGRMPIIGVGGVYSGESALAKIEAGATLIQLYSSLIFEGIGLVDRIKLDLADAVTRAGAKNITELVGSKTNKWAAKPVEV